MMTKYGKVCYRSKSSKCSVCKLYIQNYKCWNYDYINYMIWQNCIGYECKYFDSIIKNKCNSHYIHKDYEMIPIKEYRKGKYRFNSKGEKI